jgi:hypothetical protein
LEHRKGWVLTGAPLSCGVRSCARPAQFERLFREKTGNDWDTRHDFEKVPGKFEYVPTTVGDDDDDLNDAQSKVVPGSLSLLPKQVQRVIQLIFDVDAMKATMKEMEIDTEKMPLGKLEKEHIQKGCGATTSAAEVFLQLGPDAATVGFCF